jgi:hypothetical protein
MGRFGVDDFGQKEEKKETTSKEKVFDEKAYEKAVRKAEELRKLDERNPMEQANKFDEVRRNPPKQGYMRVECHEAIDENGDRWVTSCSVDGPDSVKWIKHEAFFVTDLYNAIAANVAGCPINVGPMLLDQGMKLVDMENKKFKPEKRKDENMFMVVFIIAMIAISCIAAAIGIPYLLG